MKFEEVMTKVDESYGFLGVMFVGLSLIIVSVVTLLLSLHFVWPLALWVVGAVWVVRSSLKKKITPK